MASTIRLVALSPFAHLPAEEASILLFQYATGAIDEDEPPEDVDHAAAEAFCEAVEDIPLLTLCYGNMVGSDTVLGCLWHGQLKTGAVYHSNDDFEPTVTLAPLADLSVESISGGLQLLLSEHEYLPGNLDVDECENDRPDLLPRHAVQRLVLSVFERDAEGGDPSALTQRWMTTVYSEKC